VVKELSLILLNFTLDFWLYTEDGADIKIEYHSKFWLKLTFQKIQPFTILSDQRWNVLDNTDGVMSSGEVLHTAEDKSQIYLSE